MGPLQKPGITNATLNADCDVLVQFVDGDDPVLGWMASNVVAHLDAKDNIYPRKERPENKIDGIVALIMAISRAITPGQSLVIGADYELVAL